MTKPVHFAVRLTPAEYTRLSALADETGQSRGAVLRALLVRADPRPVQALALRAALLDLADSIAPTTTANAHNGA